MPLESELRSVARSRTCGRISAQETRLQSGVWSCILPGLPTYLVQQLSVGPVVFPGKTPTVQTVWIIFLLILIRILYSFLSTIHRFFFVEKRVSLFNNCFSSFLSYPTTALMVVFKGLMYSSSGDPSGNILFAYRLNSRRN